MEEVESETAIFKSFGNLASQLCVLPFKLRYLEFGTARGMVYPAAPYRNKSPVVNPML